MISEHQIREALKIDTKHPFFRASARNDRRLQRIKEAISWPSGPDPDDKITQEIWRGDGFIIELGKPGKETLEIDRHGGIKNSNDMLPKIIRESDGQYYPDASFHDINKEFERINLKHQGALEKIACLLFRDAYLLDHILIDGHWRYRPPKIVIDSISENIKEVLGIPPAVFMQFIDALAWNEDVKYFTKGYWTREKPNKDAGQPNNLRSAVSIISVLSGKLSFIEFIAPVFQSAVRPIQQSHAFDLFPYLRGDD